MNTALRQLQNSPAKEKPRVLIVDSDYDSVVRMKSALDDVYRIDMACNGGYALGRVRSFSPDLILLAASLPDQSGVGAFRAILEECKRRCVAVVLVSARVDPRNLPEILDGGTVECVGKPVDERELRAKVHSALRLRRCLLELQETTEALRTAQAQVSRLRNLIPICAHCRQQRDDKGYWSQVEAYVETRPAAESRRGLCAACAEKNHAA